MRLRCHRILKQQCNNIICSLLLPSRYFSPCHSSLFFLSSCVSFTCLKERIPYSCPYMYEAQRYDNHAMISGQPVFKVVAIELPFAFNKTATHQLLCMLIIVQQGQHTTKMHYPFLLNKHIYSDKINGNHFECVMFTMS